MGPKWEPGAGGNNSLFWILGHWGPKGAPKEVQGGPRSPTWCQNHPKWSPKPPKWSLKSTKVDKKTLTTHPTLFTGYPGYKLQPRVLPPHSKRGGGVGRRHWIYIYIYVYMSVYTHIYVYIYIYIYINKKHVKLWWETHLWEQVFPHVLIMCLVLRVQEHV